MYRARAFSVLLRMCRPRVFFALLTPASAVGFLRFVCAYVGRRFFSCRSRLRGFCVSFTSVSALTFLRFVYAYVSSEFLTFRLHLRRCRVSFVSFTPASASAFFISFTLAWGPGFLRSARTSASTTGVRRFAHAAVGPQMFFFLFAPAAAFPYRSSLRRLRVLIHRRFTSARACLPPAFHERSAGIPWALQNRRCACVLSGAPHAWRYSKDPSQGEHGTPQRKHWWEIAF